MRAKIHSRKEAFGILEYFSIEIKAIEEGMGDKIPKKYTYLKYARTMF